MFDASPKKKYPCVSILIPCYEAADYVEQAINCALAQTYCHIEVIVAPDDGDTYLHLRDRLTSSQLRIIAPGSRTRTGAGATRNRAIDASTGDYFAMLDADDLIPPTYIEELMRIAAIEGAAIAPTRYVNWDNDTTIRVPPMPKQVLGLKSFSQTLASIHPLIHRSLEPGYGDGFAQDVIHDAGIFAKLGTITIVNSVSYDARQREGSVCNQGLDAEQAIQAAYAKRIHQILKQPTTLQLHSLPLNDRLAMAQLFRFRAFVSILFSASGAASYNAWIAGNEARLWDEFCRVDGVAEVY